MESRNGRHGVRGTSVESLDTVRTARRLRIASRASVSRKAMATGPATGFIATIQVSSRQVSSRPT
jgi:hypothetical protein